MTEGCWGNRGRDDGYTVDQKERARATATADACNKHVLGQSFCRWPSPNSHYSLAPCVVEPKIIILIGKRHFQVVQQLCFNFVGQLWFEFDRWTRVIAVSRGGVDGPPGPVLPRKRTPLWMALSRPSKSGEDVNLESVIGGSSKFIFYYG